MNESVTKKEVEQLVDKAVVDLSEIITNFSQQIDTRFAFIEQQLKKQDSTYEKLLNTIDGFIGRIDHYETEQFARDRQFERLLAWARKVSQKTGIPLESL